MQIEQNKLCHEWAIIIGYFFLIALFFSNQIYAKAIELYIKAVELCKSVGI